ncbi:hypothetical protein Tco_0001975 [Tanacetum coccineum]
MANLEFYDTNNMVAYLKKPEGSEGFYQIVDFLNVSHIRYALTENPIIYVSPIKQFWQTATARTLDNGEIELTATIDGTGKTVTEASVRRHLQLADADGISSLPTTEIFEQLSLMGRSKKRTSKLRTYEEWTKHLKYVMIELKPGVSSIEVVTTLWILEKGWVAPFEALLWSKVSDHCLLGRFCWRCPTNETRDNPRNHRKDNANSTTLASCKRFGKDLFTPIAATTATSLDAEQDRGNINKTQSKATPNEPNSLGTSSEFLLWRLQRPLNLLRLQVKRRVKKIEWRNKSRTYRLKRLYKVGSSRRVESSNEEGLGKEDASKQGMIADIDANEDFYLVNVQTNEDMFGVNDLDGDEVIVESVDVVNTAEETSVVEEVTAVTIPVSAATTTTTTTAINDVEMTLAQALAELKSAKPKADKDVIQEPEQGTTTPILTTITDATTITAVSTRPRAKGLVIHEQERAPTPIVSSQQPSQVKVQDKGKGKMVEPKPMKKMSKKELLRLDVPLSYKLKTKKKKGLPEKKLNKLKKPT